MAPHDALGVDFELDIDDIEAGIRAADRYMKSRLTEALRLAAVSAVRRAKVEHRYINRTGALTKSIHHEAPVQRANGMSVDLVADAPHAAPIHYGSRRHVIAARNAKALAFFPRGSSGAPGDMLFRRAVWHPGTVPDAFLEDAVFGEFDFITDQVAAYASEAFDDAGF